jgi:hypothetical protein
LNNHPSATKYHQLGGQADFEMETGPQDALAEIERMQESDSATG